MKGWAGIARMGGVGDDLVAASVCRPLKRLGYNVEMITTAGEPHVVFLNNPFIDKLSLKADGELPSGGDWQKWFVSRSREYEVFAHLSHSMEYRHALFADSTAFWWPPEYRRKICAGSYLETAHDIAGVPYEFGPLFFPTEEEKLNAATTLEKVGPFLAWVLSGSRIDKVYPFAPIAVSRIIKELDIPVVLMGVGDRQHDMAMRIETDVKLNNSEREKLHIAVSHPGLDAAKQWGIRPSLTLATLASMVVTPDTGLAWAVAMEEMPKVVMVSHASAENITKHWVNTTTLSADPYRVPCSPCHRLHSDVSTCTKADGIEAAACMADISVETVVRTVDDLWNKKKDNVVRLEAAE